MEKASEVILSLQPVTFHYKKELDPKGIPQFGLVAEQVEKVDANLVARDQNGKPYSVRYEAVNAMLLNEFLKEHHNVGEQTKEIGRLKSDLAEQRKDLEDRIAQQQKQIAALATGLQKVSGQLESRGSSARVLASN
jgi:septal ring factor EnvC (AmiA/AmiB activator)